MAAALHKRHWRQWYNDSQYRSRRKLHLQRHPMCKDCSVQGRSTPATITDHVVPHQGDLRLFRTGKLRSLCTDCHNRKWADDARGYSTAVGLDGWPTDPRHPAYTHERKYSTT